jgi:hypothetical protein
MLDRVGDEVARATSIVRYAPGSHFSPHTHGGGKEFLVLDGVFEDEHGSFPADSYIRNPPGTSHTPGSELGCTICVKLWQLDPHDRTQLRLDADSGVFAPVPGRPGVDSRPLFEDAHEQVRLERWVSGAKVVLPASRGIELVVLGGGFTEGGEPFAVKSWLRLAGPGDAAGSGGTAGLSRLGEGRSPRGGSRNTGCRLAGFSMRGRVSIRFRTAVRRRGQPVAKTD